ncbi:MAG: hypothetical protein IIY62_02080 [Kiritimatiellae bacterium]|nr:hypothetical protein [Kiritimatiellia bacterium]
MRPLRRLAGCRSARRETRRLSGGLWRPTASESSGYVFPSQMFFRYTIDIQ